MVSPRGHVRGRQRSDLSRPRTERDTQGRPIKVTDPLRHETNTRYDGNGNLETETDPEGNKTTYTYDADNERTEGQRTKRSRHRNRATTATDRSRSQTDGNKHVTKYKRNALEQVAEVIDPLKTRKTIKEYDPPATSSRSPTR